jgi:large subunit ribosomal protein L19
MATDIINKIEREQMKKEFTPFYVGDSVKVHCRVVEGGKERIQIFAGICIARRGTLSNESFTVRKIASGEGVERTFPLHSPKVAKVEIAKSGKVRRARLNYLRDRVGKSATNLKEPTGKTKGSMVGAGVAKAAAVSEAEAAQKAAAAADVAAKEEAVAAAAAAKEEAAKAKEEAAAAPEVEEAPAAAEEAAPEEKPAE